MLQPPNYIWTCTKCASTIPQYIEDDSTQSITPPKCPKCGKDMVGGVIVHEEPHPHLDIKY